MEMNEMCTVLLIAIIYLAVLEYYMRQTTKGPVIHPLKHINKNEGKTNSTDNLKSGIRPAGLGEYHDDQ